MPRFEFNHPPPSRPAVEGSAKDFELLAHVLNVNPQASLPSEGIFGFLAPILNRWLDVCETTCKLSFCAHRLLMTSL